MTREFNYNDFLVVAHDEWELDWRYFFKNFYFMFYVHWKRFQQKTKRTFLEEGNVSTHIFPCRRTTRRNVIVGPDSGQDSGSIKPCVTALRHGLSHGPDRKLPWLDLVLSEYTLSFDSTLSNIYSLS